MTPLCISDLQFRYREASLRDRGLQTGYRSIHDDPRMKHVLSVSKLQSDNEYGKDFAKSRSQFHSRPDQPGFLQAKRSQQLASSVCYRQPLPQPTCDPRAAGPEACPEDPPAAERCGLPSLSGRGPASGASS